MDEPSGIYTIGAVARLVGTSPATLRNWEQRYGLVHATRSPGGQRLYGREQLERLLFVRSSLDEGLSPGEAHRLLAERDRSGTSATPAFGSGEGATSIVLLVERDRFAAELAEFFLLTEGYETGVAFDAASGREKIERLQPRLLIVELLVSGGEGVELCRHAKQQRVPAVIAVSPLVMRAEALAAGADAFILKPFDPLVLVSTARDLLSTSALTAPSASLGATR